MLTLPAIRLTEADNPNVVAAWREDQAIQPFPHGTIGDETILAIGMAGIGRHDGCIPFEVPDIGEIDAVLLKVCSPFVFIPTVRIMVSVLSAMDCNYLPHLPLAFNEKRWRPRGLDAP